MTSHDRFAMHSVFLISYMHFMDSAPDAVMACVGSVLAFGGAAFLTKLCQVKYGGGK